MKKKTKNITRGLELEFKGSSSWLGDAEYTIEEQGKIYDDCMEDVIANPRWYLDNLDYLAEFKVGWVNYTRQNATKPYGLVKKRQ